jgi:hypothetical protein
MCHLTFIMILLCFLNSLRSMKSLKCNTFIFSQIKIFKDSEHCKILMRVLHCDLYLKGKMFYSTSFKCIIKNIHTSHTNVNVNPKIYMTWSVKKLTLKYKWFTFTHNIGFIKTKSHKTIFPHVKRVSQGSKSHLIV